MVIFLDTGPLGAIVNPKPKVFAIINWYNAMIAAGHRFKVPAIADFEVRRELTRINAIKSLAALDSFNAAPDVYLPLTDSALKLAARWWAHARNTGQPTAHTNELDCDVIIAAQASDFGLPPADYVIATVNVGHLSRFVPAQTWSTIAP